MSDEGSSVTPAAEAPPAPTIDEILIEKFISTIRGRFPVEHIRQNFRVTPRGLFIAAPQFEPMLDLYHRFAREQTEGSGSLTIDKLKKRLFKGIPPRLLSLDEGKFTCVGYLLPRTIREPQKYQLPFFVGTLTDARSTLHTQDPILAGLADLKVEHSGSGMTLRIDAGGRTVQVSEELAKRFAEVVTHSRRTLVDFPKAKDSLSEAIVALVHLLQKCRAPRRDAEILVPARFEKTPLEQFRTIGGIVMILSGGAELMDVYELRAGNLAYFLRKEFSALRSKQRRIGSFEIHVERDPLIGHFMFPGGRKVELTPRAFSGFIEHLGESPDKRDHLGSRFTVGQAFERFSTIFQLAQPIEPRLISDYLNGKPQGGTRYSIFGSWLFEVSKRNRIERCIAKHARKAGRDRK